MRNAPFIGQRVRFAGSSVVGPCSGVIEKVYVKHTFNEDESDAWNARNGKRLPESQWHACMRPDTLPAQWCYQGSDVFAPQVADLIEEE